MRRKILQDALKPLNARSAPEGVGPLQEIAGENAPSEMHPFLSGANPKKKCPFDFYQRRGASNVANSRKLRVLPGILKKIPFFDHTGVLVE